MPSESLLAAIRLLWWIDAILDAAPAPIPLLQNLRILIKNQPELREQFVTVIGHWQNACHDGSRSSQQGWQALWQLLGRALGHMEDKVARIGLFCLSLDLPPPVDIYDKAELLALNPAALAGRGKWLYLLACFGIYHRQVDQYQQKNRHFTLLGWHVLLWCLGLPPRHHLAQADHN